MPTPIRYRTDGNLFAEEARRRRDGHEPRDWCGTDEEIAATPAMEAGDAWRLTWHSAPDKTAGYAICCPKCGELHYWSSASNCSSKRQTASGAWTCDHQEARTSCWTWTVDDAGKPIKAVASLFANHDACGYHGWLNDGMLSDG